ncbi:c-type cytochrome [Bradyrhizobium sp. AUGA SZCCT0240]|uniref:c-type cytochrome n=1 Tax=unclassified Bradyrhizobium TaxID=2631580 RepID=UPI001BA8EA89|nr:MULTISPECIES: c-type cytochrome [unclassified Bradyrhizobium]MBR1199277.1 c-type cytochrome [Bradyrhizobium sp. AUGA SZCCT0158]MBR1239898.1 c-type cytochrome [Bradyrhizobium sp. AUGA SZCCT0274]MBR1257339.1 c-type cytochrome [Bradyrhizobium sp. AUGA SZCCT0240]
MRIPPQLRIRFILLAGLAALLLGFLFMWSGLYSVAASRGHWAVTEWLLTFAMRNSVKTHAIGIEVPPLGNADLVTLGAAHFHSGCAYCHGAPGVPISPIARAMLPPPPDLATNMRPWRDRELFWIIKHGIKYTGMPAWSVQQRDDEVWALAAFLRRLPGLDAAQYRELALGGLAVPPQSGQSLATSETTAPAVGACARCHGAGDARPASALVPILHGQPAEFIVASLEAYASAQRASGIMQPVARALAGDDFRRVADYYAALQPPAALERPTDASAIARGRALAENGDPAALVPACAGCHGQEALKTYPRLAGQNLAYLLNRLRLWKNGLAPATATETIMAPIARALSDRQIEDVGAYYASVDAHAGARR